MSDTNQLLDKLKMPGRIFQLPSRGLLYSNGELASNITDAELHIQPMNAFDEITLKNPDLLFSGKALDPVFNACIPGILKPTELLGKDVDAIMLYLRLVTYGPSYEVLANHNCEHGSTHAYTVNLEEMLNNIKYLDPTTFNDKFLVVLDNGQKVHLSPSKYSQIISLLQANEGKKTLTVEDIKSNIHMNLMSIIISVDDITDKNKIAEWIHAVPAGYVKKIAEKIESLNDWGLDLSLNIKCRDCGQDFPIDLPINPISFFS